MREPVWASIAQVDRTSPSFSPFFSLFLIPSSSVIHFACVSLDGVVLAAEKRVVSKLLAPSKTSEKTYSIDDHAACLVAGLTADANILIQRARLSSQRYLHDYQQPMPLEQMVKEVCDYKQAYTQYGGLRPFGVAFLFAGWDKNYGFQLYQSDPSGNYSGWKATVIGTVHIVTFNDIWLYEYTELIFMFTITGCRSEQPGGEESAQDGLQARE